jgi:hypothetical protein
MGIHIHSLVAKLLTVFIHHLFLNALKFNITADQVTGFYRVNEIYLATRTNWWSKTNVYVNVINGFRYVVIVTVAVTVNIK